METLSSGEIRVSIKDSKPVLQQRRDIRRLAEAEFYRLNMQKTRDNTGILIYFILEDRQFYILADQGINEKVSPDTWDKIRDDMQQEFQNGHFANGILIGIDKVGHILGNHFPIKPDDTNELSNKVVI